MLELTVWPVLNATLEDLPTVITFAEANLRKGEAINGCVYFAECGVWAVFVSMSKTRNLH